MRADEEHAAASAAEPRVGIQQVCRAVQRDDRLAGAWSAVDDERLARAGPDDGVLVGLDRREDVAHPLGAAAAEARDERRLGVEGGGGPQLVEGCGGEGLVPVVGDATGGPAVAAAAGQPHRLGEGGAEEGLCRRRPPVDQQRVAGVVGEADAADVDRLVVAVADHPPEAQVEPEAAQDPQLSAQPVGLEVALEDLLAVAGGGPAVVVEAVGEPGDLGVEGQGDSGEVAFVRGDEARRRLGGVGGEVERGGVDLGLVDGGAVGHGRLRLGRIRIGWRASILRRHRGLAASPRCRYTLKMEGVGHRWVCRVLGPASAAPLPLIPPRRSGSRTVAEPGLAPSGARAARPGAAR